MNISELKYYHFCEMTSHIDGIYTSSLEKYIGNDPVVFGQGSGKTLEEARGKSLVAAQEFARSHWDVVKKCAWVGEIEKPETTKDNILQLGLWLGLGDPMIEKKKQKHIRQTRTDYLNESIKRDDCWIEFRPFKGWYMEFDESRWFGDEGEFLGDNWREADSNLIYYQLDQAA